MLFKNHPLHQVRSAGTSEKARIRINQKLLDWADEIFVMERKHRQLLQKRFTLQQPVTVLEIEDNYSFNDFELVALLKEALSDYLS